jgi:DNA invertase Pin-like site-specific DNA recombinase
MRAAIYARSASDYSGSTQIADQIRSCRRLASRNNLKVAKDHVYCDRGVSGARIDRPAFQRLFSAAISSQINALIVADRSRLSRNNLHLFRLMDFFKVLDITVFLVADEINTSYKKITTLKNNLNKLIKRNIRSDQKGG